MYVFSSRSLAALETPSLLSAKYPHTPYLPQRITGPLGWETPSLSTAMSMRASQTHETK